MGKRLIKKIIFGILLNGLALYVVVEFLDKVDYTGGWKFFIVGGFVMGILNTFIKPLLKIFTFPFILMTMGLLLIVINGFLLFLLEKILIWVPISGMTFTINGWAMYLIAGLIFGLINWFEHFILRVK